MQLLKKILINIIFIGYVISNMTFASSFLSYEKFYRVNTPDETTSQEDWFGLSLNTKSITKGEFKKSVGFSDIDLRLFPSGIKPINFSVSEAYFQVQVDNTSSTWGRKIVSWQPGEKLWGLGKLNGNQAFKLLSKKQEGLLGYHFSYRHLNMATISVFASYLHIPAMNPQVFVKDGVVRSSSEWSRKPPTHTIINEGSVKEIHYELNDPNIADIILNKSLGLNIEFRHDQIKWNIYSVYKPEPNLRINAEAFYDSVKDKVIVTANPIVNHHVVSGANMSTKNGPMTYNTGIQISDPNAKLGKDFDIVDPVKFQSDHRKFYSEYLKIEPNYDRESYFLASTHYKGSLFLLDVSFIELLSDNNRASDDFFSDTVKWKRAIGMHAQYNLTEQVLFDIDFKFDIKRKDQILNLKSSFSLTQDFTIVVGGELIKAPEENSYWSVYRANDSFYSRLKYFF